MFVNLVKALASPLLIFFLILLGMSIVRRKSRGSVVIVLFLFYLVSTPIVYKLALQLWSVPDTLSTVRPYHSVAVLSGITNPNWYGALSNNYPGIEYFSLNQNRERIIAGVYFLKSGIAQSLLYGNLSIGSYSETEVVSQFVRSQGVGKEQFVIVGTVKNTWDEASRVKTYLKKNGRVRLLLITSEMHMRRALLAFQHQKLQPDTYSVGRHDLRFVWEDFVPGTGGVKANHVLLYELLGWISYFFKTVL
ncbi:MAG: hypothetical protein NPIRA02_16120 [Nitrospirales bacterium]|nr:MAG: hypothetical protein NPIRA02_16120 [Nitrospirales bacterium]